MFYKRSYQLIDSHMHICGYNGGNLPELLHGTHAIKERAGLAAASVAALSGAGYNCANQNALCILFKALYPENYAYAGFDHFVAVIGSNRSPNGRAEQLKRFMEIGFDGIKIIDSKPTARKLIGHGLNAPEYKEFFAYLEKNSVPVLWHVADPEEFWDVAQCSQDVIDSGWCYADSSYLSKEALMGEAQEVLEAFPKLNVVFAHLYFMSADILAADAFMQRFPNVKLDVTPGIEMYYNFAKRPMEWKEFFIKYSGRILLGSDNGWGDEDSPAQKVAEGCRHIMFLDAFFSTDNIVTTWDGIPIKGIALPERVQEAMYCRNFMEMQGGRPPKAVNTKLAVEYVKDLIGGMHKFGSIPDETLRQTEQALQMLKELQRHLI